MKLKRYLYLVLSTGILVTAQAADVAVTIEGSFEITATIIDHHKESRVTEVRSQSFRIDIAPNSRVVNSDMPSIPEVFEDILEDIQDEREDAIGNAYWEKLREEAQTSYQQERYEIKLIGELREENERLVELFRARMCGATLCLLGVVIQWSWKSFKTCCWLPFKERYLRRCINQ